MLTALKEFLDVDRLLTWVWLSFPVPIYTDVFSPLAYCQTAEPNAGDH